MPLIFTDNVIVNVMSKWNNAYIIIKNTKFEDSVNTKKKKGKQNDK